MPILSPSRTSPLCWESICSTLRFLTLSSAVVRAFDTPSLLEMDSLVPKRHLVFAEMDLTRLRQRRIYRCGKYC